MEHLRLFFDTNQSLANVETGVYQLHLVALSYIVACLGSYIALSMMLYMREARTRSEKRTMHWAGAFAMAAGIWSMHFIGMLSYKMDMVITYDPWLTFLSFLIAGCVAYGAFFVLAAKQDMRVPRLFLAAVLLGFGICGMHYTGMAAMEMDGTLRYRPDLFFYSVIIAIVAAGSALMIALRLSRGVAYLHTAKVAAALVMGLAICGMHYVGSEAAVIRPFAECRYDPEQSYDFLAFCVAVVTGLVLATAAIIGVGRRAREGDLINNTAEKYPLRHKAVGTGARLVILVTAAILFAIPFLSIVNMSLIERGEVIRELSRENCAIRQHQKLMQIVIHLQRVRGMLYIAKAGDAEMLARVEAERSNAHHYLALMQESQDICGSTLETRKSSDETLSSVAGLLAEPVDNTGTAELFDHYTDIIAGILNMMDAIGQKSVSIDGTWHSNGKMEHALFRFLPMLTEVLGQLRARIAYLKSDYVASTESREDLHLALDHLLHQARSTEQHMMDFMRPAVAGEEALYDLNRHYQSAIYPGFAQIIAYMDKLHVGDTDFVPGRSSTQIFDGLTEVVDSYYGFYKDVSNALLTHLMQKEAHLRQSREIVLYSSGSAFLGFVGLFAFLYFSLIKLEGATKRVISEVKTVTLLRGVAETANSTQNVDEAMRLVLSLVCDYMGWALGHVLVIDKQENVLRSADIWAFREDDGLGHFRQQTASMVFGLNVGLPGRAWAMEESVWEENMALYTAGPRHVAAADVGLGTGFAFPVILEDKIEYVLEFFSNTVIEKSETTLRMIEEIGGQLAQVIQRVRAIENLRDLKEKAETASIAKSDFLANMSHELRTPLNSIIGMTRLLMESNLTRHQFELTDANMRSSTNLLEIVNDILDLSKIEAGEIELELIGFDLYYTIGSVSKSLKHLAKEKRLTIIENIQTGFPYVMGDPLRLSRILTNLIGNAIKYTGTGHITVKASYGYLSEDMIELYCEVVDTGIGIREDKISSIFDKFVQADSSITRKYGGTGLGLAITKQLVDMMGGRIGVHSRLGEGSTFWFRIPFKTTKVLTTEKHRRKTARFSGVIPPERARILVAEDYGLNQMLVRKIFEKFGLKNYEIVDDGAQAVEKYKAESWDIILMDCQMPEKSGYEATLEIRAFEKQSGRPPTKIVAMTANAMPGERDKCLRHGMDDYISKPMDVMVLRDILSQWIRFDAELEDPEENESFAVEESNGKMSSGVVSGKVDFSVLASFSDGDVEMEREFVLMFVKQTEELIEHMNLTLREGRLDEWRAAAHKIKGGAGGIGADLLQEICDRAQHLHGDDDTMWKKQKKIETEFNNIKQFLTENGRL